jgi:hypothetical protein
MFLVRQESNRPARLTIYRKDNKNKYTHCICGSVKHRLAVYPYIIKKLQPAK